MGFARHRAKVHYIFTNKPEYECAELFHLCLNRGMVVVALGSKALVGSPKYLILLRLVLLSDVILLARSLDTFLPISVPIAVNKPPSLKPVALSIDAPTDTPPATPAPTISF